MAGKLVLPQSAAGRQGRGWGWHMALLLPTTPSPAQPPGRRVPWEGTAFGGTVSPERCPCCKDPTLHPVHQIARAGKLAQLGAAKPQAEAALLQLRLDSAGSEQPPRLFINKENRRILLEAQQRGVPSPAAFGPGCRALRHLTEAGGCAQPKVTLGR